MARDGGAMVMETACVAVAAAFSESKATPTDWAPLFYRVLDSRILDHHRRSQVRRRDGSIIRISENARAIRDGGEWPNPLWQQLQATEIALAVGGYHRRTFPAARVERVGVPGFELGAGEMELGLGIHGEKGLRRMPIESADRIVDHHRRGMGPGLRARMQHELHRLDRAELRVDLVEEAVRPGGPHAKPQQLPGDVLRRTHVAEKQVDHEQDEKSTLGGRRPGRAHHAQRIHDRDDAGSCADHDDRPRLATGQRTPGERREQPCPHQ